MWLATGWVWPCVSWLLLALGQSHDCQQASVLLTVLRSKSKFHLNLDYSGLEYVQPSPTKCSIYHDNCIVVTCAKFCCYEQVCYRVSLNFKFDWDTVRGRGGKPVKQPYKIWNSDYMNPVMIIQPLRSQTKHNFLYISQEMTHLIRI